MATRKAAGSAKNLTDSKPKYLGTKLYAGETASAGAIIFRQRGTKIMPGKISRGMFFDIVQKTNALRRTLALIPFISELLVRPRIRNRRQDFNGRTTASSQNC